MALNDSNVPLSSYIKGFTRALVNLPDVDTWYGSHYYRDGIRRFNDIYEDRKTLLDPKALDYTNQLNQLNVEHPVHEYRINNEGYDEKLNQLDEDFKADRLNLDQYYDGLAKLNAEYPSIPKIQVGDLEWNAADVANAAALLATKGAYMAMKSPRTKTEAMNQIAKKVGSYIPVSANKSLQQGSRVLVDPIEQAVEGTISAYENPLNAYETILNWSKH